MTNSMTKRTAGLVASVALAACGADYSTGAPVQNNPGDDDPPGANTNINFGGAQDFGYYRQLLQSGVVPKSSDVDDAGFFAEHHTLLPEPSCGNQVCLQAMLGVMNDVVDGEPTTMLQLGLNSPIVVDPETRPPLNLAVVIDVSCSMRAAQKIDYVRRGMSRMLDALRDDDRIALVTYSTNAGVRFPVTTVGGQRETLRRIVNELKPSGSTNIWAGLELGYQSVLSNYDVERQNRVIMLSDGQPTAGITNVDRLLESSRQFNQDGVGLTTIGLGRAFNLELMRGLSEQGDGNFYFVENAAAIEEVFTQEVDFFTVPVAFDLELDVRAGEDFHFAEVYGSSRFEHGEYFGHIEIPSVFLAHRKAHDDVTKGDGRRGGGSALLIKLDADAPHLSGMESEVAKIEMRYELPDGSPVREVVPVVYPYSPQQIIEGGYFDDPIVTKSFMMMNIVVGLRRASDLFHAGDGTEAIAGLMRLLAAVIDYEEELNDGAGDLDMRLDMELIGRLIQVMQSRGARPPLDARIPDDPWPGD